MAESVPQPRGVHLVGSVPLGSAEEVFRVASGILGDRLRRLPDGETGERLSWIGWQLPRLLAHPQLEPVPPDPNEYVPRPRVRPRPGVSAAEVAFPPLGYAEVAVQSYALFARLKAEGALPGHYRFQVSLPTPVAPLTGFVVREAQAALEPAYEARILAEVDAIAAGIPHHQLAVQWDVAVEVAILEGVMPSPFTGDQPGLVERLVRLGQRVPADVELGYHLCYGDYAHQHFKQPADLALPVELANAIAAGLRRPLHWVHMPVPRDRADDAYFAPLRELRLPATTERYLGLVHFTDGIAGTRQRIAAARRRVSEFGVATECGLGRRPPETIPELLRIHAAVAGPAA